MEKPSACNSFFWKHSINTLFKDVHGKHSLPGVHLSFPVSSLRSFLPSPMAATAGESQPCQLWAQEAQVGTGTHSSQVWPCWVGLLTGELVSGKHLQGGLREASQSPCSQLTQGQGQRVQLRVQDRECPLHPTAHQLSLAQNTVHRSKPWNSKVTELREEPVTLVFSFLFLIRG